MDTLFSPKPDTPRQTAEKVLAQEFLTILKRHHRNIQGATSVPTTAGQPLEQAINDAEQKILNPMSYQNWTLGFCAGAVTYAVLMGVAWRSAAAATRFRLPQRAPLAYRDLDAISSSRHASAPKNMASRHPGGGSTNESPLNVPVGRSNEGMDPTSLKSETFTQVQMMVYGATGLVVTIFTSWYFTDKDALYRNMGRLPLAPGKSMLCQAACPDLVEHYRSLLVNGQHEDMRRHPETVELDAMFQFVLNCQQRSQWEADVRQRENLPVDELVEVPTTGVPFNYLGLPVPSRNENVDGLYHKATDDMVEEYDWLQKLALDRTS